MKNFCTVSDISYINQGLALYQSLAKNMTDDFVLWYCCMDKEIYDHINKHVPKTGNLITVYAQNHKELKNTIGTTQQSYAWDLSPRFMQWLIKNSDCDHIMYMDADIVVYPGFGEIFYEIGDKSIAFVPHMHLPPAPCQVAPGYPGGYNNGSTYIKNNTTGKKAIDLWVEAVNNPYDNTIRTGKTGHRYTIKLHNTCGEQRFLEMFPIAFPDDTHILGQTFAYGAPWNMHLWNLDLFSLEKKVVSIDYQDGRHWMRKMIPNVFDIKKNMLYYHFSGFTPHYDSDSYSCTREKYNEDFMKHPAARMIYEDYYLLMKHVKEEYYL